MVARSVASGLVVIAYRFVRSPNNFAGRIPTFLTGGPQLFHVTASTTGMGLAAQATHECTGWDIAIL